jgi:hypothetical protein
LLNGRQFPFKPAVVGFIITVFLSRRALAARLLLSALIELARGSFHALGFDGLGRGFECIDAFGEAWGVVVHSGLVSWLLKLDQPGRCRSGSDIPAPRRQARGQDGKPTRATNKSREATRVLTTRCGGASTMKRAGRQRQPSRGLIQEPDARRVQLCFVRLLRGRSPLGRVSDMQKEAWSAAAAAGAGYETRRAAGLSRGLGAHARMIQYHFLHC